MTSLREIETEIKLPAANSDGVAAPPYMSYEEFLDWADEDTYAEWVDGVVEMASPAGNIHQDIVRFLTVVIDTYVEANNLGITRTGPFQMKLKAGREPDLLFLKKEHLDRLGEVFLDGPADLVIEVVSKESRKRDRVAKFKEYAEASIPEYWLIDPLEQEAKFYRLEEQHKYQTVALDSEGRYQSQQLLGFWLKPEWLWQKPLPNTQKVLQEIGGLSLIQHTLDTDEADYTRQLIEELKRRGLLPPA